MFMSPPWRRSGDQPVDRGAHEESIATGVRHHHCQRSLGLRALRPWRAGQCRLAWRLHRADRPFGPFGPVTGRGRAGTCRSKGRLT